MIRRFPTEVANDKRKAVKASTSSARSPFEENKKFKAASKPGKRTYWNSSLEATKGNREKERAQHHRQVHHWKERSNAKQHRNRGTVHIGTARRKQRKTKEKRKELNIIGKFTI